MNALFVNLKEESEESILPFIMNAGSYFLRRFVEYERRPLLERQLYEAIMEKLEHQDLTDTL